MAGVAIRIEVDDASVRDGLARLQAAGGNLSQAMDEIGQALVASTLDRFERGVGPDGDPWRPSIRARETGGQTLVDSARLRGSITHRHGPDSVEVGTNVIYAAVHQLGATIRPVAGEYLTFRVGGRYASKREVTIPPRPFLGIDTGDRAEISAILADHIEEAWGDAR